MYDLKTASKLISSDFSYLLDAVKSNMPATQKTGEGRDRRYFVDDFWLTQYALRNAASTNVLGWFDTTEFRSWAQSNAQAVDMIRATMTGLLAKIDELKTANAQYEAEGLNRITRDKHYKNCLDINTLEAAVAKLESVVASLSATTSAPAEAAAEATSALAEATASAPEAAPEATSATSAPEAAPRNIGAQLAELRRHLRQAEQDEDERVMRAIEAEIDDLIAPPAPAAPATPARDPYEEARNQRLAILDGLVEVVAEYDRAALTSANEIWRGKIDWDDYRYLYRVGSYIIETSQGEMSGAPSVWASPELGMPRRKRGFFI